MAYKFKMLIKQRIKKLKYNKFYTQNLYRYLDKIFEIYDNKII